jgi:hypothetical protein
MAWESALGSAIEVAIGIAGFSGIVAAVGRRGAGHWTDADQIRLRILLTASGASLVFSFLPFVLVDVIEPPLVWRLGSALVATYMVGITILRVRQASIAGIRSAIGMRAAPMTAQAVVVGLLLANALWLASSSLYVAAVLYGLGIAFLTFIALLLDSWREPPDEQDAPG